MSGAVSGGAFDLEREPAAVRQRYGDDVNGQSMLLARRLVEGGVPFVSVQWQARRNKEERCSGWDTHANNFYCLKTYLLPYLDVAFSALIAPRPQLFISMGGDETRDFPTVGLPFVRSIYTLYGHPGGDRALVFVAKALRASSRAEDLPARLGGDEFALLAPGIDAEGMEALAQRLMAEIRFGDAVRISAGWVVGDSEPSQLLLEADEALRAAKRDGKNRALSYS